MQLCSMAFVFHIALRTETVRLDDKIAAYRNDSSLSANEKAVLIAIKRLGGVGISQISAELPGITISTRRSTISNLI